MGRLTGGHYLYISSLTDSTDGHHIMMIKVTLCLSALVALTLAETVELDEEAKNMFVNLHNQYREETGAEMPDLEWDDTLAAKAAEFSSKCEFYHPLTTHMEKISI